MLARRILFHAPCRSFLKHSQQWPIRNRQLSSSTGSNVAAHPPPSSPASALAGLTTELDKLAPRTDIRADQVTVIESPAQFYETLKTKIRHAQSRIYLSTLYIGKTEDELIASIHAALSENPELRVSILTDALRGTREAPDPSCASLLAPLVAKFPKRVEVRMYHTPLLTGLRRKYIPKRINEGWGLQHMKLYGVDDEVILSGANLSKDYFTNRQDRYHLFTSTRVANYFGRIHDAMCGASFRMRTEGTADAWTLDWPKDNTCPNPLDDPKGYIEATKTLFAPFTTPQTTSTPSFTPSSSSTESPLPSSDTALYPLLIIPSAHNTELRILTTLLSSSLLPSSSSFLFTAGYFNPHPAVTAAILHATSTSPSTSPPGATAGPTRGTVLTASPWANGFFGSAGVSGMLPGAYTLLARRFLARAKRAGCGGGDGALRLREWRNGTVGQPGGWTYHAKGLWVTLGGSGRGSGGDEVVGPSVTVVGSSNYTTRSNSLDTEVGAVLVTGDDALRRRLRREEENLLQYSREVGEEDLKGAERRVGLGTRIAMLIVRMVGGSL